jgi:hypothetical protein
VDGCARKQNILRGAMIGDRKNQNSKHQAPSSREAPKFKHQTTSEGLPSFWILVLDASLELGAWSLVLI